MIEFLDSTEAREDSPELRRRMDRDGYLFFRAIMPTEPISDLREQYIDIVSRAGWLDRSRPATDIVANIGACCAEPMPAFMSVYRQIYRLPKFHAIKHHPVLMALMRRVLGERAMPQPLILARSLFPNRVEDTTPAHQDYVHIGGTLNTITAWIPMMDCPDEVGGLEVARGSHLAGVRDFEVTLGAGGMKVTDPLDDAWSYSPYRAGDVLLFHAMTVHRGRPNRSQRLRFSVDCRFQPADEPISEISIEPQGGVFDSWNEVYDGWPASTSELQHYWQRENVKIVPLDRRWYEMRDEKAFKMAEEGDNRCRSTLVRVAIRDPDPVKRERAKRALALIDPTIDHVR